MLSDFFQFSSIPTNTLSGTYDFRLVLLSYFVATMASYIALDMAGRLRDIDNTKLSSTLWLLGGSLAMGAGIWSMHFIGMLAFQMQEPMSYDLGRTILSMIVAILASGFALFLLKSRIIHVIQLMLGGIILGLAIATMHYIGMSAMNMIIHYEPTIFLLSIVIAILASEAALWLCIKSNQGNLRIRIRLKLLSAFVMGAAICGMHYTGMAAAIFTPINTMHHHEGLLNPEWLSIAVALVTFLILGIAFAVSTYKEILNQQAIQLAHQGGMAEVASSVLHNVGNVLNSINTSATLIEQYIKNTELSGLLELNELLTAHQSNLSEFIASQNGSHLPEYINQLSKCFKKENDLIENELKKLMNNLSHVKEIIFMQQSFSGLPNQEEVVSIPDIIDEAITMSNIDCAEMNISIKKHYSKIHPIIISKLKVLQILINLIRNAKHSLLESSPATRIIDVFVSIKDPSTIMLQVVDNGVGISKENMARIFTHGFTTKKYGHGYGLHSSAIAAKEMGGSLNAHSDGKGKGATFTLELPYKVASAIELGSILHNTHAVKGKEHAE